MGGDKDGGTDSVARPCVAAVDDSEQALTGARWAADHARRDRAPLRLVHAYRGSGTAGQAADLLDAAREAGWDDGNDLDVELCAVEGEAADGKAALVALYAWQPDGAGDAVAARRLDPWLDKYPDVHVVQRVVRDQSVRALRHPASSARLLVIGNRGPDGYRSLVLGGTGQQLIRHAAGPIAIVRADTST